MAANHLMAGKSEAAVDRSWVIYLVAALAGIRFLPLLAGGSWRGAIAGLILTASLFVGKEAATEIGVNPGLPARVYSGRNRLTATVLRGGFALVCAVLGILFVAV